MQATIHHVARRAGVSIATVSRALSGSPLVRSTTVAAVTAAAESLGYRPGFAARAMRSRRARTVGVALLNHAGGHLQSLHNYEIVIGLNQGLERAGMLMVLLRLDDIANGPGALALREHAVDGIVCVGELPAHLRGRIRDLGGPITWVDGPEWTRTGCLRRDETAAGALAMAQTAAAGHRAVRYIDGGGGHHAYAQRRAGAQAAARRLGVACSIEGPPERLGPGWADGRAVIVSDLCTMRSLTVALAGARCAPGVDVAIACCDDAQEFREGWPQLSRVAYDRFALGAAAAGMVTAQIAGTAPPSRRLADAWLPGSTLMKPAPRRRQHRAAPRTTAPAVPPCPSPPRW